MANASPSSESPILTEVAATTPSLLFIKPANQINSVKLSDDNFLLWHLQVLAGIRGLGLEDFILADPPIPSNEFSENGNTTTSNLKFINWNRQDQLLFSFLLSSMTEAVQGQMIGCTSSSQLWLWVSRLFASRSKAKVKLQLQTLKKGNQSMKDYLSKMKHLMDILAACGHSISEDDQILYILSGVGFEYDSVIVHVTSRVDTLALSEVDALLLTHEGHLELHNNSNDTLPHSVNIATLPPQNKAEHFSSPRGFYSRGRGRGRGRNTRGGRRFWNNNNGRSICQICGITGHVAEICYYRFDADFVPKPASSFRPPSQVFLPPPHQGHPRPPSPIYPSVALATATSESAEDEWWFPDSGASHHVTNNLGNLTIGSEYTGGGKVHVGNGAGSSHASCSSPQNFA